MKKGLSFLSFLFLALPALAKNELPAALTQYYQPAQNEFHHRIWLRKEEPELEYSVCLDKQTLPEQRIVVMCGYVTEAMEPDTAPFDIWYLDGDKITARTTTEGYGRMGTSGDAAVVKMGTKWGVVLESGYMLQGFEQTFQQFYIAEGEDIQLIASLPVHSSSEDFSIGKDDYPTDNVDTVVTFAQENKGEYPAMLLHSTGLLNGKNINKRWSVNFDAKTHTYSIPKEIDIGY